MPRTEINPSIKVAIAHDIKTLCFLPIAGESPAGIEVSLGDMVTADFGNGVVKHFLAGEQQASPWWVMVEINRSTVPIPAGSLEPKRWQGLQRGDRTQVTKCNYPDLIGTLTTVTTIDWLRDQVQLKADNGTEPRFLSHALQILQ